MEEPRYDSGDPSPLRQPPEPKPWRGLDLVLFGTFFGLAIIFLPAAFISLMSIRRPYNVSDMTAMDQILLQAVLDLALIGFIVFIVKILHGRSFLETIHWHRSYAFKAGALISLGAMLAVTVTIVTSLFPPKDTPAMEKLINSVAHPYVFALFAIAVAPVFEEVIFRGFLFKVFFDMAGPGTAISLTAGLFALLHLPQLLPSWAGILMIFVVGYVLAVIRSRSGSLISSLIVHTSYNGMLFAMYAVSSFVMKGSSPS